MSVSVLNSCEDFRVFTIPHRTENTALSDSAISCSVKRTVMTVSIEEKLYIHQRELSGNGVSPEY